MSEEDLESEVLRSGLTARPLDAGALARIREATEREWKLQIRPQRVRKNWTRMALAASAAVVTIAAGLMVTLTQGVEAQSPALGRLERVGMQGAVERNWLNRSVTLNSGDLLRAGETVHTRSNALVTLANGGTLRLAAGAHINVVSDTQIRLTRGVAYVDIPPGTEGAQFVVQTPVGEVAHVGTQFEVAVLDSRERVRVRVREGQIALRGTNGQTTLAGSGTELLVQSNGAVRRQPIATSGRDWSWVESLAPEFVIENRLLGDYLQWAARETGRNLTMNAGAQQLVASTRLHGSVHGLTLLDSLTAVMETSALHMDTPEGLIRVSSGRDLPLAEKAK